METQTTTNPSDLASTLRAAVKGRVIAQDDPDYDAARAIVYGGVDPRPAVIVKVADASDIATVIATARETGAPLAVRSGGHSGAGYSNVDDGVVIDVRALDGLDLDPDARTAWAGSGVTAGEYTAEAARHGLATGFGDTASVGLGGLITGGGVGYLVRKHGLTIDNLLAAEVVTADGQVRVVDAEHEPDLFWAIRGGGGNVGVVTRFKLTLHELDGVVGGMLILPATAETVAGFIAAAEAAPEELSTIANVMPCPPMPFVPEEHHGSVVILGMLAYAGGAEEGERALAPFRALAEPLADMVKPIPYPEMFPPDDPDYHPTAVARTMFIDHVDASTAETIMSYLTSSDASMRVAQLRVLGGAVARVAPEATAYAHRASRIMVNLAAFYEGEEDKARRQAWVDEFASAIDQGDRGMYVNFVGDEGEAGVRAAYPGVTWDRLAAVKAAYDPENVFRRNQNVPPAGA
ncbi:MAG TPA: FAD-binding oxidoreductase [Candidatus Limnocylindrales bacterium]|nr:FAD-binding oxidoreductase [Candidatus Limnocylindrales bacterium]